MPRQSLTENTIWQDYVTKFDSYGGTITIKDFCKENNISRSQFYYHKRKMDQGYSTKVFHAVSLKVSEETISEYTIEEKNVNIIIGNANISIPTSETSLISSIIKELATKC